VIAAAVDLIKANCGKKPPWRLFFPPLPVTPFKWAICEIGEEGNSCTAATDQSVSAPPLAGLPTVQLAQIKRADSSYWISLSIARGVNGSAVS
jgi:hypothetical protein